MRKIVHSKRNQGATLGNSEWALTNGKTPYLMFGNAENIQVVRKENTDNFQINFTWEKTPVNLGSHMNYNNQYFFLDDYILLWAVTESTWLLPFTTNYSDWTNYFKITSPSPYVVRPCIFTKPAFSLKTHRPKICFKRPNQSFLETRMCHSCTAPSLACTLSGHEVQTTNHKNNNHVGQRTDCYHWLQCEHWSTLTHGARGSIVDCVQS